MSHDSYHKRLPVMAWSAVRHAHPDFHVEVFGVFMMLVIALSRDFLADRTVGILLVVVIGLLGATTYAALGLPRYSIQHATILRPLRPTTSICAGSRVGCLAVVHTNPWSPKMVCFQDATARLPTSTDM